MNIAVLLSGCGVYDGSEIHESVFVLYHLTRLGHTPICVAPDTEQYHVVNHRDGSVSDERRNTLTEAARIARGAIRSIEALTPGDYDALVIPGGFGAAKNLTSWAFDGPNASIRDDVRTLVRTTYQAGKPIVALCMGPTVVAKALEGMDVHARLTVGTTTAASPYDIPAISSGLTQLGAIAEYVDTTGIIVDNEHRIISAPCYMMEASIVDVHNNIGMAIDALDDMLATVTP
ncbi:MAG TPA: isoprenoid biosynthesis glyoxalase ElbB [Chlorobiota bacterium]|nr:isoprenoid biosynthesis glyoxalase ElbB [Chlorobiota bacterium]